MTARSWQVETEAPRGDEHGGGDLPRSVYVECGCQHHTNSGKPRRGCDDCNGRGRVAMRCAECFEPIATEHATEWATGPGMAAEYTCAGDCSDARKVVA